MSELDIPKRLNNVPEFKFTKNNKNIKIKIKKIKNKIKKLKNKLKKLKNKLKMEENSN